jgi:YidC/Oxa1 family membrane protein insertase
MALTMAWQMGMTPTSPGMDPTQQKIMRWGMPIMMVFVLYNVSSGLTLYWTVQNLLTIAQTAITKSNDPKAIPAKAGVVVPTKKKK